MAGRVKRSMITCPPMALCVHPMNPRARDERREFGKSWILFNTAGLNMCLCYLLLHVNEQKPGLDPASCTV